MIIGIETGQLMCSIQKAPNLTRKIQIYSIRSMLANVKALHPLRAPKVEL